MNLPDDTCRCHDDYCPKRLECSRWLGRNDPGEMVVHAITLRDCHEATANIGCGYFRAVFKPKDRGGE